MSIALAERAIAPPPHAMQPVFFDESDQEPQTLGVAVIGTLKRQAEVRISVDGGVHLYVQVIQPAKGMPFITMWHRPAEMRPELEHLAAQLTPGSSALLRGHTLMVVTRQSLTAVELVHCESVSLIEFTQPNLGQPS